MSISEFTIKLLQLSVITPRDETNHVWRILTINYLEKKIIAWFEFKTQVR